MIPEIAKYISKKYIKFVGQKSNQELRLLSFVRIIQKNL